MTSSFLHTAAKYEEMFKGMLDPEYGWDQEIKDEIAWAKRVLKKSDRIVWWLRWVKLGILKLQDVGVSPGYDDFQAGMKAYNAKAGESYPDWVVLDMTPRERMRTHGLLEHLFSMRIPAIQDFHPGFMPVWDTVDTLDEIEKEHKDAPNRYVKPEEGDRIILEPASGWAWWELSRGFCENEARAMGHCGNEGSEYYSDETILSYRKRIDNDNWEPYLTFIRDENHYLGEMKGRKNSKPTAQFYPAIEALLASQYVDGIKGGGYKPENNFAFEDLPEKDREELAAKKPMLYSLRHQYGLEGFSPSVQKRVEEMFQRSASENAGVEFDPEEQLFHVTTGTVGSTVELIGTFANGSTKRLADDIQQLALGRDRDIENPPKSLATPLDWKSLLDKLPEETLQEMEETLDCEDNPDVAAWYAVTENSELGQKDRVLGLIEAVDDDTFPHLLEHALRKGLFAMAQKQLETVLRSAIRRSMFREHLVWNDTGSPLFHTSWVATLTPDQAVEMASEADPPQALRNFTRWIAQDDDAPLIEVNRQEIPAEFTEVDESVALKNAIEEIHKEAVDTAKKRRNRERQLVTAASKQAQRPPTATMYHVSRSTNRQSIKATGLVPQIVEFPDLERKPGVYLLEAVDQINDWAYWFGFTEQVKLDIWEVTLGPDADVEADLTDMDDIYDSWICYSAIPANQVRLLRTMGPKFPDSLRPPKARKVVRAGITPADRTLYHGTNSEQSFDQLKPNQHGLIWLGEKETAGTYATSFHHKGESRTFEVKLSPAAKIVDLRDPTTPVAKAIRTNLEHSLIGFYGMGYKMPDSEYTQRADFGLLEYYPWVRKLLRSRRIDAVVVADTDDGIGMSDRHDSMAVLNPKIIESATVAKAAATRVKLPSYDAVMDTDTDPNNEFMFYDQDEDDYADAVALCKEITFPLALFRALSVASVKDIHLHNFGVCWSETEYAAIQVADELFEHRDDHETVVVKGSIATSADVDWLGTIRSRMTDPFEEEVRLKPGATVQLSEIRTVPGPYKPYQHTVTSSGPNVPRTAANVQAIGRRIRQWAHSDASMELLDKTSATGATWSEGGCWILAAAVQKAFGGELHCLIGWTYTHLKNMEENGRQDPPSPQHIVVKLGNVFLDSDGASSLAALKDRFERYEGRTPEIVPFTAELQAAAIAGDIPQPEMTNEIADLLKAATTKTAADEPPAKTAFIRHELSWLKDYLTMSDRDKGEELARAFPDVFKEYLEESDPDLIPTLPFGEEGWLEDFSKVPASALTGFLEDRSDELMQDAPAECPSFMHMEFEELVKNQWLIHKTDDPQSICQSGFTIGMDDLSRLGLTTYFTDKGKTGGYNFAFLASDAGLAENRYGRDAIIFRASGVQVYHYGDEEDQVVFRGSEAHDIIPVFRGGNEYEWVLPDDDHGKPVFGADTLAEVVQWVEANFAQYRKVIVKRASADAGKIPQVLDAMMEDVDRAEAADEENPWFNCTTGAEHVIEEMGEGEIWGYQKTDNPTAELSDGAGEGGHDFAIIGNNIVDFWASDYFGTPGIIPLTNLTLIHKLYGDPMRWSMRTGGPGTYRRLPAGEGLPAQLQESVGKTAGKIRYGCIMTDIPKDSDADECLADFAAAIDPNDLAGDGIEKYHHVTLRYGLKGTDITGVKAYLESLAPFDVTLGLTEMFPPSKSSDGAEVVIAPVIGDRLAEINKTLAEKGDFKPADFEYYPHATIAYVAVGRAAKYVGRSETQGVSFRVSTVTISDAEHNKTIVQLRG